MKQSGAIYLVIPLIAGYLTLCVLPISATLQEKMMRKFHMTNASKFEWCVLQLLPSMYNFSNTAEVLAIDGHAERYHAGKIFWLNHYPTRIITFYPMDAKLKKLTVEFSSRYRGTVLESSVELQVEEGKMRLSEQSSRFIRE